MSHVDQEISEDSLLNYGVSRQRSGITVINGSYGFFNSVESPHINASFLTLIKSDMTRPWNLYTNGSVTGHTITDFNGSNIIKQFFTEVTGGSLGGYSGSANYGAGTTKYQHVVLLESTNDMSPISFFGSNLDQSYRVRFEFDLRQRLYLEDPDFLYQLNQLNHTMRQLGYPEYNGGVVIDETQYAPTGRDGDGNGYDFTGTLSTNGVWETLGNIGIPNPMYGWLKVNIATALQLLDDGSITKSMSTDQNELTLLSNGQYLDGSVLRTPGEIVDLEFQDTVYPYDGSASVNNIKTRVKTKGRGWFKRFGKLDPNVQGTYPMSYRLTMSERGFALGLWDDAGSTENDDYAWIVSQRLVNNISGETRSDPAYKYPVHCLYSCSRESLYPRDFGIFYQSQAISSHVISDETTEVNDYVGNTYTLNQSEFNTTTGKTAYILDPFDKEDPLASDWIAKPIWRYVVREYDKLKPWDVHKSATRHETDSNAIINSMEQLAITDDNRFVITFPTGLTTQSFMYPGEEIDLICFSSADVISEGSTVPMVSYARGSELEDVDKRRYYGLRSTLPNGNGMRVCILISGDWILNTDVNIDAHT
jgi:hypothetical protein